MTLRFPFDELSTHDREHVDWVKSQRDPELWHLFATAVLVSGDPHGFLVWLFDQPETDRATAGYVFLGVYGREYLTGRTQFGGEGLSDPQWLATMEAVCHRAASAGFSNDALGLAAGFEAERQACLDLVNRGMVADPIAIPSAIINTAFPPEQKLRYFVEDGIVLDHDPMAF